MKSLEQIRAENARLGFDRKKSGLLPPDDLVQLVADLTVTLAELAERCRQLEDFRAKIEKHGCGFYQLAHRLAETPAPKKGPRPRRRK